VIMYRAPIETASKSVAQHDTYTIFLHKSCYKALVNRRQSGFFGFSPLNDCLLAYSFFWLSQNYFGAKSRLDFRAIRENSQS
jgi:hypothetical protein